ncbi:MAG: EF-hand domain-containing protein [Phycisphaerales bacterium]
MLSLSKLVAIVVSTLTVGSSQADLYAIRFGSTSALFRMDETTGVSERVGTVNIAAACGLDFGPDGMLYTFTRDEKVVYRIDPATSIATAVGPLGVDFDLEGGIYVVSETEAYAVVGIRGDDFVPRESKILSIDLTTGAATEIWRFPRGDLSGITMRSDGKLVVYGAVATYSLYLIDLDTRSIQPFGPQFIGSGEIAGLTSDGEIAYLLLDGVLVRTNLFTGVTSAVSAAVRPNITGLAMGNPVCVADCDGSGQLDPNDIDCFVAGFLAGDALSADCDGNGSLNFDDIDCFVAGFLAGCP